MKQPTGPDGSDDLNDRTTPPTPAPAEAGSSASAKEPKTDKGPATSSGEPATDLMGDLDALSRDLQGQAGTEAPGTDDAGGTPERPLDPPKLIRLANLAREVLEEVRQMAPQDSTVQDLAALYKRVEDQLKDALPQVLAEELDAMELDLPFRGGASQEEVRIAYSGLIGWLGGLFQGLHASLLAAAPVLELGGPGGPRVPGVMPPGTMPRGEGGQTRAGLEPPGPVADPKKGEGYL